MIRLVSDGFIETTGRPTEKGRRLIALLPSAAYAHLDNTGMPCRIDFAGHDCCWFCECMENLLLELATLAQAGVETEILDERGGPAAKP